MENSERPPRGARPWLPARPGSCRTPCRRRRPPCSSAASPALRQLFGHRGNVNEGREAGRVVTAPQLHSHEEWEQGDERRRELVVGRNRERHGSGTCRVSARCRRERVPTGSSHPEPITLPNPFRKSFSLSFFTRDYHYASKRPGARPVNIAAQRSWQEPAEPFPPP